MNKKVMSVIGLVLAIVGISTCFCVAIFFKEDVEVKIERGGICNPLNPVSDKTVKISDKEKEKILDYWEDIDLDKEPEATELCDCLVGDYKLFIDDKVILFNLDLGYVSIDSKYIDIDDEFLDYIIKVVKENDTELIDDTTEPKEEDKDKKTGFSNEEWCSCCPDLKPGESCIAACCECP